MISASSRRPKVSVVIPTKNGGSLFREVLTSVLAQETNWPYEVIVVDSGSKDETVPIIESFPEVKLIRISAEEFQHGRTRNLAIAHAKGEYIAVITQDALPYDDLWLAGLVDAIEQTPEIAGVFGRHIAHTDASVFTRQEIDHHFLNFESEPVVWLQDCTRYERDPGYRQKLYFFSNNNALIRRSIWEQYPYPEIDFSEDQAWARSIIEAGFKKAYAQGSVVYHSHNYGLFERFQRSFDESRALEALFRYNDAKGVTILLRRWLGLTLRDIRTLRIARAKGEGIRMLDVLRMPIDNLMRVTGGWLGSRTDLHTPCLVALCSRDQKLKRVKA